MEHKHQIERLQQMDPQIMADLHLNALIDGIADGELTVQDIFTFTNIGPVELEELLNKRRNRHD